MKSLYLLLLLLISWTLQAEQFIFNRITTEEGLSSATVRCLLQDRQGYLWIGTSDGLNRYDGYEFETFRTDPERPGSLQSNAIEQLFEDEAGYLWVCSASGGLSYYDPEAGCFVNFSKESLKQQFRLYGKPTCFSNALPGKTLIGTENGLLVFHHATKQIRQPECGITVVTTAAINCLYMAADSSLWAGTLSGFSRYNREQEHFVDYTVQTEAEAPFPTGNLNGVHCIHKDRAGFLWIGTGKKGVFRSLRVEQQMQMLFRPVGLPQTHVYDFLETRSGDLWIGHSLGASLIRSRERSSLSLRHYFNQPEDTAPTGTCPITRLAEDANGSIWFSDSRYNRGQYYYTPETEQMNRLYYQADKPYSISSNQISCLYIDRTNNLWMGHTNYGLSHASLNRPLFRYIFGETGEAADLTSNHILSLYEDRDSNLWVGSTSGLERLNHKTEQVDRRYLFHPSPTPHTLSGNMIGSLAEDTDQTLWISYLDAHPDRLYRTGRIQPFYLPYKVEYEETVRNTAKLCISDGQLWLTTTNGGVMQYDPALRKSYYHTEALPYAAGSPFSYTDLFSICADSTGGIWIGTEGKGLRCFDRRTDTFTNYTHSAADTGSLASNQIRHLFMDSGGTLWVGTHAGLDRFNPDSRTFTHYTTRNGLTGNVIQGIQEAEPGILFVSTNKGLTRLDTRHNTTTRYTIANGLLTNEFIPGACCKRRSGELVFGSNKGLLIFHPEAWARLDATPPPAIRITATEAAGEDTGTKELRLPYASSKDLKISFIAFCYAHPQSTRFRYMLEKQDTDWKETDATHRYALYNQLAPGRYHFLVKASADGNRWSEPARLSVTILPPWWQSLWFLLLASAVVCLLFYLLYRRKVRRYQLRLQELERREQARLKAQDEQDQAFIEKVTRIVLDNLQNANFDVDQFCSAAAMSRANLFRKLKASTGLSASAFTRDVRIRQAVALLTQSPVSVNEVASAVGFTDPGYFSRCFKEIHGLTPSQYQKEHRQFHS